MAEMRFQAVIAECLAVVRAKPAWVGAAVLGFGAVDSVLDLAWKNSPGSLFVFIASLFVEFAFLRSVLADFWPNGRKPAERVGSLFATGFLGSLGILAGLVLLVLPGLYIAARWSISPPFVVVEGMSGRAALAASWRATKPAQWALLLAIVAIGAAALAGWTVIVAVVGLLDIGEEHPPIVIGKNLAAAGVMVGTWVFAAAGYRLLAPMRSGLSDVFA